MIRLDPVSSTALLLRLFLIAGLLASCTGLPRYGVELPPLPAGLLTADDVFVMADGARLPMRTWLPKGEVRAAVLALHGFNDSRDAWEIPGAGVCGGGDCGVCAGSAGVRGGAGAGVLAGGGTIGG